MKKTILILIFIYSQVAFGQINRLNFQHFDNEKGLLPQSRVMVQDREGFLWLGGSKGLMRFDGYNFENFNQLIFEKEPYKVLSLLSEGEFLWIGTETKGLIQYHLPSNSLKVFEHSPTDDFSILSNQITQIYKDRKGNLWLGTWFGLSMFNPEENNFFNFPFKNPGAQEYFNYSQIEKITEDREGNLWLGTWGGGLHHFNVEEKNFRHFEKLLPKSQSNTWVKDIKIIKEKLWIATIGNGLIEFDPKTSQVRNFTFNSTSLSKGYNRLLCLYQFGDDNLWIGSEEGLILFDLKTKDFEIIKDNGLKQFSLTSRVVEKIFEDNHRGIWILAGGLNYYNYKANKFTLVTSDDFLSNPKSNEVHGFLDFDENEVWISQSDGMRRFDIKTRKLSTIDYFNPGISQKMIRLRNGQVAAIGNRDGLTIFDPGTEKSQNFKANETDLSKGLISQVLFDVKEDSLGNLWIAGNNGISYFRFSDNKFFHITSHREYSRGLKSNSIIRILSPGKDNIAFYGGNQEFQIDQIDPRYFLKDGPSGLLTDTLSYSFKLGIQSDNFRYSLTSENSLITIGTDISAFDFNSVEKRILVSKDEIWGKDIRGAVLDDFDGLWITTNSGLFYLNINTKELTGFFENDGVQANGFNPNAILRSSSGKIFAGGNNGFNVIDPSSVYLNDYLPPVKIVKLQILNKPILQRAAYLSPNDANESQNLDVDLPFQTELILTHKQNFISFEFASLNFLHPEENQYAYQLEGVDQDWIYIQNRRFVSYSNLPEGKWLNFRVKGSNNNGIWSNEEASIRIFITPPFYNTFWFKLLAAILILSIMLTAYFLRIARLKTQRRNLASQVKERTIELEQKKQEIEGQNQVLLEQSEELKIQNSNTLLFSEMGKKITASIDLKEIYQKIYELMSEVINTSRFAIGELNEEKQIIEYHEIVDGSVKELQLSMADEGRLSVLSLKNNQPIFSNNIKEDIKLYLKNPSYQYEDDPTNSAIYIPLVSTKKKVIGIFVVKCEDKNAFSGKQVNLLQNIAVYISIALDNSNKYKKIEEQSKQLQEMDRIKTRFYTNISHEFRTPLSLILGPTEELAKEKNLSYKDKKLLRIIQVNAIRLLRLVNQIMDLSKIDDGVLRLEVAEGEVLEYLNPIIDSFYFVSENKIIQFRFKQEVKSVTGYFDRDKIEKITYNLLNNAFKYTEEGKEIEISIRKSKNQNGFESLQLEISDTGIGISSTEIDNIFKQYYRVDNPYTQNVFGTGIGLSLVKKLIELHHGTLEVRSAEKVGTSFTVTIPLERKAYQNHEIVEHYINSPDRSLNYTLNEEGFILDIPEIPGSVVKPKIMIVEDNEELLIFLKMTLSDEFDVIALSDSTKAHAQIISEKPQIIISDIMMPKLTGLELCKLIKSNDETKPIPVILLTAKSSQEDLLTGLEYGADEYLSKPVNIDILKQRIKNLLNTVDAVKQKYENGLLGDIEKLDVSDAHKEFVRNVIKILEENITNQNLNIDFFAHELGVSRTLLYEKIKKATGDSLGTLIKNTRLNFAVKLLLENQYNSSELAYAVGFSDPKYFSKCFKNAFGKTPKDYLKHKLQLAEK